MDVVDVTEQLFAMMEASQKVRQRKNSGRPPTVTFGWGHLSTFKAV